MNEVTIRMDEHFDLDATMESIARERFAMPPEVIAAFRQAAMLGAKHLLTLVSDPTAMKKLSTSEQLKVLSMIFDRAYGNSETASSSLSTLHKVGQLDSNDNHGDQLTQIEKRMRQHNRSYPELKKAQAARKRASRHRPVTAMPNALGSEEEIIDNVVALEKANRRAS